MEYPIPPYSAMRGLILKPPDRGMETVTTIFKTFPFGQGWLKFHSEEYIESMADCHLSPTQRLATIGRLKADY